MFTIQMPIEQNLSNQSSSIEFESIVNVYSMKVARSSQGDSHPGQRQTPKRKSGCDEEDEEDSGVEDEEETRWWSLFLTPFDGCAPL